MAEDEKYLGGRDSERRRDMDLLPKFTPLSYLSKAQVKSDAVIVKSDAAGGPPPEAYTEFFKQIVTRSAAPRILMGNATNEKNFTSYAVASYIDQKDGKRYLAFDLSGFPKGEYTLSSASKNKDGKTISVQEHQTIDDAARKNGVYIVPDPAKGPDEKQGAPEVARTDFLIYSGKGRGSASDMRLDDPIAVINKDTRGSGMKVIMDDAVRVKMQDEIARTIAPDKRRSDLKSAQPRITV
jgi:hypothetical protein